MGKRVLHIDITLFKRIKAGEIRSFEILFDKYYKSLCNFAFLFLKNEEQSEEVVSDVFMRIWIKKEEIDIQKSVKAFLYKSTRNAAISDIRKEKNKFITRNEDKQTKEYAISPESLLIRKEICESFKELIDNMPKQAALVFRLHKVDDMNYREIAELLELSVKTVENHMGRALKMMRSMYTSRPDLFNE